MGGVKQRSEAGGTERLPLLVCWLPALVTAAVIFYLSHRPDLADLPSPIPDWGLHLIEYGFFTLTLLFATTRGFDARSRSGGRASAAVVIASLYGISDEFHQSFVGRDPTLHDWVADTAGALLAAAVVMLLWRRMAGPAGRL